MPTEFLLLPEDDDALIFRADASLYGLPARQTLAKWACRPSEAPCELPYTQIGRKVAYRAGVLRKLQNALTFKHSTERLETLRARRAAAA